MKNTADKWDIGKLETTPFDLSRLSGAVKDEVFKKTKYDELVEKVNAIDTTRFIQKTNYNAKINEVKGNTIYLELLVQLVLLF